MATSRETRLIDTLVANFQATSTFKSLPPATQAVINSTIEEYAALNAKNLLSSIDSQANFQLNTIPTKTVGINNPLDIVNGNLSASQVSNTVSPVVQRNINDTLIDKLVDQLYGQVVNKLPPVTRQLIDLNGLKDSLFNSATVAVPNIVDDAVGSFSSDVMSGKNIINPFLKNVDVAFASNPQQALDLLNSQFDTNLSSEALSEAQKFDIKNPENEEKLIVQTTGFLDPAAQYPTKEYSARTEVNKLATGDINGTIVQTKEKERRKGIQLPNGQSWEQPPIPFKGEYPYNKVIQTESGHIIETDDTPGAERLHIYHRSGTFVEIDANGSIVKRTKGSSYEIIDRNGYISVNGDCNLSVKNGVKIFVGGDADIEVEGDTNINCFNDITMQAAGRIDMSATEEINIHSNKINIEADDDMNIKADGSAYISAGGVFHQKSNSTMYLQTLDAFNLLASGSIYNQTDGAFHVKAADTINADGSSIYWNSGTSDTADPASYSFSANIGLIGGRRDIIIETIKDPISPTYLDKLSFVAEDSEFVSEAAEQERRIKELGLASETDINTTQIVIESDTPRSTNSTVIMPSSSVLSQTYLPDNYQLSTHFTLGQLSSKAVVSNYPVQAQLGLSYGDIVYNLQAIALNILEPVLALYPNMFVTSAFRTASSSSTTSDHPKGRAVDIQFKGARKEDYFVIAKKLSTVLNYDKLLLEYKTYGTGLPWIHISFNVQNPRKLVLTYLNDRKYGDGLANLA